MGAGRTELVSAIFGIYDKEKSGDVYLDGKKLEINSPMDAISNGIGLIPEDRKEEGLLLDKDLPFNMTLPAMKKFIEGNSINHLKEIEVTEEYIDELNIKTSSIKGLVEKLSGGNQQKVVIGKWLITEPEVLILDEPTRGIDVGAKIEVYRLMNKLVEEGVTVIMISSELPEIMGMSDRIIIMCEGEKVAEVSREDVTKEKIMEYSTGSFRRGENE
jgi:ABC-type sugar transport system ATPase subunit